MFRKIKRPDGAGGYVIVEVPGNYALQDGEEFVSNNGNQQLDNNTPPSQLADGMSRAQVEDLLNRARNEERTRLNGQIERERQERVSLQQRLETIENGQRQRELESLPANERQQRELRDSLSRFEEQQRQSQQMIQQLQSSLYATQLAAYRERVLRAYGENIIPEMVSGNNETEIDASAAASARLFEQYRVRFGVQPNSTVPNTPIVQTQETPPVQQQFYEQPGSAGFPSPVNPGQVQDPAAGFDISALTTEESVRQGRWSGELRQQVLDNLRQQSGGGAGGIHLGNQPRFMNPMGMATLPGGAQHPIAQPMAPAASPQTMQSRVVQQQIPAQQIQPQYQQPSQVQPAPSVGNSPSREAAMEAVRRTHAGGNPIVNGDGAAATALREAQAMNNGVNPSQVYSQRFNHTPPLQQQT